MRDNDTLIIRHGVPADALMLAELGARTFIDTFEADNDPSDIDSYVNSAFGPQNQAAELADPARVVFVAEIEGEPVGYAQLRKGDAPECVKGEAPVELGRLYVSKDRLGRGVGQALMGACVEQARGAGHQTMWLGVWERNYRAQAFYRKWDFRVVGQHLFLLGSDQQIDLLMERTI